ncbi:hypothetical protein HK103_001412 [Boothiomyces macroporosus]|uniref:Uncharacterized protein n=1 Tax=Boothiomyces macroporosus TaxID=261099 RepID=A0AAD5UEM4_9FUNG|nr:hypothetical protein HK103_001412 [Boothiomyces macroporosus]
MVSLINAGHSHGHSHGHDHSGHAGHSHFEDRLLHDEENPHEPHTHTHNGQVYHQLPTDLEEIVEQDPLELNTAVVKAAELLKKEHTHTDLNLHGVYLHLFGDLLTSIGVISSTLIIIYVKQDWTIYMDPLMSLLITVIIIISTIPLCRSAIFILLQATPQTISLPALKKDLMKIRGIANIHELHVWQLSDTQIIGSVHVVLAKTNESYMEIADLIKIKMHDHGIHSSTVQPEFVDEYDDCALQCPVGCDELRCCPLERTE